VPQRTVQGLNTGARPVGVGSLRRAHSPRCLEASPPGPREGPRAAVLSPSRTVTPRRRRRASAAPRPDRAVRPHGCTYRRSSNRRRPGRGLVSRAVRMARGVRGRADRYKTLSGGPRTGARWSSRCWAADASGSTTLRWNLTAGQPRRCRERDVRGTVATGNTVSESNTSTVPRLLLGARVSFSALSTVHTFVGVDGELGPARAGADCRGRSRLPSGTLGLALGATVGTQ